MRVAAVQLEAAVADVPANLEACERLADRAGEAGAECIVLPEFFTTGIGFVPELAEAALPPDGEATELLRSLARRHGALVGGSFLCRDPDLHVRNAFLLARPDGEIAGRHDKDLPTMWENALYVGGEDDGVIEAGDLSLGAAVCWELMRTQTARRLRGRVDLLLTGSGWWSIPDWPLIGRRLEAGNWTLARRAAREFCLYVGAPLAHAAHAGELRCELPWSPLEYRGRFEGESIVCDADGTVLAARSKSEGEGFVIAEVTPGRTAARRPVPDRFWLHRRPPLTAFTWWYQRIHGRPWYEQNVAGRPATSRRERIPA